MTDWPRQIKQNEWWKIVNFFAVRSKLKRERSLKIDSEAGNILVDLVNLKSHMIDSEISERFECYPMTWRHSIEQLTRSHNKANRERQQVVFIPSHNTIEKDQDFSDRFPGMTRISLFFKPSKLCIGQFFFSAETKVRECFGQHYLNFRALILLLLSGERVAFGKTEKL